MAEKKVNLDDLRNTLSAMLTRKDVTVYLGSLFSVSYLANLNYKGIGPKPTKLGRNVQSKEIKSALQRLIDSGIVKFYTEKTKGRPITIFLQYNQNLRNNGKSLSLIF